MAFTPYSAGTGTDHSELITAVIANSVTVNVGELVKVTTGGTGGFITNGTAAAPCLGIIVALVTSYDAPLSPAVYAAGSATSSDVTQVVAASDNQTNAQKQAVIEVSPFKKFSAQVNGTLGTTNNSPTSTNKVVGGWVDVDSADSNYDRVLESSFNRTVSASLKQNFYCWGIDPASSTRILVSIASSERIGAVFAA